MPLGPTPPPPPTTTSAGALAGLRVVELGEPLAAPLVGLLLAEQGAEVVRVVDPGTLPADALLDGILARGKTQLSLDLSGPAGRDQLQRLVRRADVLLESVGAAGRERLGLDPETLRATAAPGLVSCSLTAFPPGDPQGAGLPGHEPVAAMLGYVYATPLGSPRHHELPIASVMGAGFAANSLVAALIARTTSGRGQAVEASLFESGLFSQLLQLLMKSGVPRSFMPLRMASTPFMGAWPCADDRYLYLHITVPAHAVLALELLEQAGHGDEVAELRRCLSPATLKDPSRVQSVDEARTIRRILGGILRRRPADEWEGLFGTELCCIKVRTASEWLRDSAASGMADACDLDDPLLGPLHAPGAAVCDEAAPPVLRARTLLATPDELLARWEAAPSAATAALPAPAPAGTWSSRPPLHGRRVIDFSRVIAGPMAARLLAELGAEVLSVTSPTLLDWALSFHLLFNAGKRSVTLDFTTPEGKQTLWALLEKFQPDALVLNYRSLEVAQAAGLDPTTVRGRFPGLVYSYLNGYGITGEWQIRPAFEQVVQAVTGIQTTYGQGGRPRLLPIPILDIGSGLLGAYAALLGLYKRATGGEGSFWSTHMTSIAMLLQVGSIADAQRQAAAGPRGVTRRTAEDPRRRIVSGIFRALDGHALVAGPRGEVTRWLASLGIPLPDGQPLAAALAPHRHRLLLRTIAGWQATLQEAGVRDVALVPSPSTRGLLANLQQRFVGPRPPLCKKHYPGLGLLAFQRAPLHLRATPAADLDPPPVRGADTVAALAEIGVYLPEGTGLLPYPPDQPLLPWLLQAARWGLYAMRSGTF